MTTDFGLWLEFIVRARRDHKVPPGSLLCLDPGETTGYAFFENGELVRYGHINTKSSLKTLDFLIREAARYASVTPNAQPFRIVMENYRVYSHRAEQHIGSEVRTVQVVGVVKYLAEVLGIPLRLQMASVAKVFATDKKLKAWDLYQPGFKHATDAVRHGVYALLFAP